MANKFEHTRFFSDEEWADLSMFVRCRALSFGEVLSYEKEIESEEFRFSKTIGIRGKIEFGWCHSFMSPECKVFPVSVNILETREGALSRLTFLEADETEVDQICGSLYVPKNIFDEFHQAFRSTGYRSSAQVELRLQLVKENQHGIGFKPSMHLPVENVTLSISSADTEELFSVDM